MTFHEFERLVSEMVEEERVIRITKGEEYAHDKNDRLANFKRIAAEIDLSPMQVWYVYFKKHIDAIASYVKNNGKTFSDEDIEGRIMDARVYLSLLRGLIEEENAYCEEQVRVNKEFCDISKNLCEEGSDMTKTYSMGRIS